MKKFTAILLTVIMVASLFTSCSNSIAPNIDETVSVSFDEATSRSLTASLENFVKGDYFWKYAARKADTTGLTSGATSSYDEAGAQWVKGDATSEDNKGLGSVAGFSQGKWDFQLFAYKAVPSGTGESATTSYKLVYQGELTGVSLKKGSDNSVKVSVSPVAGEEGTLVMNENGITFKPKKVGDATTGFTKVYTVTALGSTSSIDSDEGKTNEWTLDAGAYKVNVDFVKDGYVYATGSVVATVYSNLTTTVSGQLDELLTEAIFDSSINPDIMNKVASSSDVVYSTLTAENAQPVNLTTEGDSKVQATVPAAAAATVISNTVGSDKVTATDKVRLYVSVDTTAATSSSLSLEISMNAVVTKTADNGVEEISVPVENLGENIAVVEVSLQPGLNGVCVAHNSVAMSPLTTVDQAAEGFFYDSGSGILTIKTKSFSPFSVTYDAPVYVAKIGDVSYMTLQGAVNAANKNDTIVLIKDVFLNETVTIDKSVKVNLNGYTISGNGVRALHIKQNTTHIYGPGTITSNVEDVSSSVIRLGDNDATGWGYLYIHEGVTVKTDTAYGITVFGKKGESLKVYGSVISNAPKNSSYDGCAISTVGDDTTQSSIYIYDGAVISAANTNAIYIPSGNLYVYEGSTITGRTGIYAKSGYTKIDGGTIIGNGEQTPYSYYGNGGVSTGNALVVDNCGYPNGVPSVLINGGEFISANTEAIGSYGKNEEFVPVKNFIVGGTFSSDPSSWVRFDYISIQNGSKWDVRETESSITNPIHIKDEYDWFALAANSGYGKTSGKYYVVDKDLDFSELSTNAGINYFEGYIDFQEHTVSGLNDSNTRTYRYPSIFKYVRGGATIKNLNFELPYLGQDNTVKPIGRIEGVGDVTLEKIAVSGNLSMGDNNTGLIVDVIGHESSFQGTVNMIDCTSTCNMVNSGYSSVFIGGVYSNSGKNDIIINATNCINYGNITSTGQAASMLISNPTRGFKTNDIYDKLTLNISGCKNEGTIKAASGKECNLVMPSGYFYGQSALKEFEVNDNIINSGSGKTEGLSSEKINVVDGKFDLITAMEKAAGAARYELTFGFQGTGGIGGGGVTNYTFNFASSSAVENINAYYWVNYENATGKVTPHEAYGTTFYSDEDQHYVYNQDGCTMSGQPVVTFVAYAVDGSVMLVDYYSYPKN